MLTPYEDILRKTRLHQLACDIVNDTVNGRISDETATKITELSLPPLKQQWVRDQVKGIRSSQKR
jgi:hypothetical protein